eukprot:1916059-Rhodomonas_salina.1
MPKLFVRAHPGPVSPPMSCSDVLVRLGRVLAALNAAGVTVFLSVLLLSLDDESLICDSASDLEKSVLILAK